MSPRAQWNVFDPMLIRWRLAGSGRAEQLRSLSEPRAGFEPAAARYPAPGHAEQCASHQSRDDMAVHGRAGDLQPYLEADILFHRTLLEASGNEMLAALADVVAEVLSGRTLHGLMPATPEPGPCRTRRTSPRPCRPATPTRRTGR